MSARPAKDTDDHQSGLPPVARIEGWRDASEGAQRARRQARIREVRRWRAV